MLGMRNNARATQTPHIPGGVTERFGKVGLLGLPLRLAP